MRSILPLVIAAVVAGCGGDARAPHLEIEAPRSTSERIVYIDIDSAENLVKHFPVEPDPADDAHDPAHCKDAGGEWADAYDLGVLIVREPQEGTRPAGQMCWSTRQPQLLADAGKPCSGQADCIGNCVAEQQSDGHFYGPPKCQTYAVPVCGPLYEDGKYHWIYCPIP